MSDMSLFFEDVDTYLEQADRDSAKAEEKARRKNRFLAIACLVGVTLLLGEFLTAKVIKPSMSSPKVTVTGQENYTAQEIAVKLLPINATSWWNFDVKKAVSILSQDASISKVKVSKTFPDKIFIQVTERTPVCTTFILDNGRSVPMQIDSEGVLFNSGAKTAMNLNNMPIVSGIPVEHYSSGMRIPQKYKGLIEQISKIQQQNQNYFASLSEICVVPKEFGNYELVLIPSNSHVKILTDRTLNSDALNTMMVTLDIVRELGSDIGEVDLRYGSVSYRLRDNPRVTAQNEEIEDMGIMG